MALQYSKIREIRIVFLDQFLPGGVDRLPVDHHPVLPILLHQRDDPPLPAVLALRVVGHPASPHQLLHHKLVVSEDLGLGDQVSPATAQRTGVDTVAKGGLVETDKRLGVHPVASRLDSPASWIETKKLD